MKGLGVDIIKIKRFAKFKKNENNHFLLSNFSAQELKYCLDFKDCATHLAGTFAAKEAVWKALGQKKLLASKIEIRRDKNGQPTAWLNNKQQASILLSISHTDETAIAVAIKI